MTTPASCTGNYGESNKPWGGFVGCEAEREFCQSGALLRSSCAKTSTPSLDSFCFALAVALRSLYFLGKWV